MFFRYLQPLLQPFRDVRTKWQQAKMVKGNIKMDVRRVKNLRERAQKAVKKGKGHIDGAAGKAKAARGRVADAQGKIAAAGKKGSSAGGNGVNPGVRIVGWFRRRKVCQQCQQELDKTWDACPYCAQAAGPSRTQAFMLDAAGSGAPMQLLGWIVPVAGPQRGELYTLAPVSIVGTEPTCHVVLHDQYMSSDHAEIKAEGGVWMLRDLGSTNGTFVNDRRVDQHELVDNDFIKFGQSLVKFKSL